MLSKLRDLLQKYDVLDEYTTELEKHTGASLQEFIESIPPSDWICSAFMWIRTPTKYKWLVINIEWRRCIAEIHEISAE